MKERKVTSKLRYPLTTLTNDVESFDHVYLLLHGYSESADLIYKRLGIHLEDKGLVVAVNGLFPLVDRFPLERKPNEKLLRGYAWYFYDPAHDHYLIDYDVPASALGSLLQQLNPDHKPVTLLGYSQGGYLAPFVAAKHDLVERVIGINCSYRHDLFPEGMNLPIDAIQGMDDPIIDIALAQSRHEHYVTHQGSGTYQLVENENHRLSPGLVEKVLTMLP